MSIKVTSRGANPVSLRDVKEHLRVDHTDDDSLIAGILDAAVDQMCENLDRTLGLRTWVWTVEDDCRRSSRYLSLPYPPLIEVVAVRYLDDADVLQDYDAALYESIQYVNDARTWLRFTEPASSKTAVEVEFKAGEASIPFPIQQAIKMMCTRLYEHRGELVDSKLVEDKAVFNLINPYRPMVV